MQCVFLCLVFRRGRHSFRLQIPGQARKSNWAQGVSFPARLFELQKEQQPRLFRFGGDRRTRKFSSVAHSGSLCSRSWLVALGVSRTPNGPPWQSRRGTSAIEEGVELLGRYLGKSSLGRQIFGIIACNVILRSRNFDR
jgi:hypothetical protein